MDLPGPQERGEPAHRPIFSLTSLGVRSTFTLVGEYQPGSLDAVFGAVADPTRRAILARLASSDARVTEIAADFPISLNSTSKHIRVLERAGLVTRRVMGRDHMLSINAHALLEASRWVDQYRKFWEDRLAALDAFVKDRRVKKNSAPRRK